MTTRVQQTHARSWRWLPLWLWAIGHSSLADPSPEQLEFFENRVRPVLIESCYRCHSAAGGRSRGGLLLDTRDALLKGGDSGPAIVPGNPETSLLIRAVRFTGKELQMPPDSAGGKLPPDRIADLEAWVLMGAPDPRTWATAANATADSPDPDQARGHWAFQRVEAPPVPAVQDAAWVRTPVDAFVLAKLEARGLPPAPTADPRVLLRRVYFDLIGLPPSATDMEAFLADTAPEAYERVVDRLLASPRYGERWGRHWLDVARYADTKGYVFQEERRFAYSYTYRDYVIAAFNEDKPYDQFLLEQIAADRLLQNPAEDEPPASALDRSSLAALGFLTLGRRFLNNQNDIIDDRIDVVMRGTQGLTVGCARCHDHKFDPISTADYYALHGVFASSREPDEKPLLGGPLDPAQQGAFLKARAEIEARREAVIETEVETWLAEQRAKSADYLRAAQTALGLPGDANLETFAGEQKVAVEVLRRWMALLGDRARTNDPVFAPWKAFAELPSEGFAGAATELIAKLSSGEVPRNPLLHQTLTESSPAGLEEVARRYAEVLKQADTAWQAEIAKARKEQAPAPARLANEALEELRQVLYGPAAPPALEGTEVRRIIARHLDNLTVKHRQELAALEWQHPGAPARAMALEDSPRPRNSPIFVRGNPGNPGTEVPRRFVEVLAGPNPAPFTKGSGRLELAQAIASRDNPLTARVFVNRVWGWRFGTPLVPTPSDFGVRTDPPEHRELLDWLAVFFMDNGWSVKKLHRQMLLSRTYRQASVISGSVISGSVISGSVISGSVISGSVISGSVAGVPSGGDADLRRGEPREAASPTNAILKTDLLNTDLLVVQRSDPDNRRLDHFPRRRLDFEALRDALLAVSGRLDLTTGGQPADILEEPFSGRRTVYGFIDRQNLPGLFRTFDFANPDASSPGRFTTTVPQQALFLMNSPFVIEQARAVATWAETTQTEAADRIHALFARALQRSPEPDELELGQAFLARPFMGPSPLATGWQYGLGRFDEQVNATVDFVPMTVFAAGRVSPETAFPLSDDRGYASLTASGGHPGNTARSSVVRRWTSPANGVVRIEGRLQHGSAQGDGVRARVVRPSGGLAAQWQVFNSGTDTAVGGLEVQRGEMLDFLVDCLEGPAFDSFSWAPTIRLQPKEAGAQVRSEWNAEADFGPVDQARPSLTPLEQLAQVLLLSNEFAFVD